MSKGKAIIFSAPSGSGKTTIVKNLLKEIPNLQFSTSATSRSPRAGEIDGKDYHFLSVEQFKTKASNEEFIEWEEVYADNFYGTLKSEIDHIWAQNKHVIFDVDVKGGVNLKKYFGEKALAIFVKVPDLRTLEDRLKNRGSENAESLQRRLDKAEHEMSFEPEFDVSIVNIDLDRSFQESIDLVNEFLSKEG